MVAKNGYSVQLVDAVTKEPLREYTGPSGKVFYAEAKPGSEYFLRLQVLPDAGEGIAKDSSSKGVGAVDGVESTSVAPVPDTDKPMMYFRPSVDGKDLGFYTNLSISQGARDVGLWTYVNGIGTNKALKFNVVDRQANTNSATSCSTTTGKPSGDVLCDPETSSASSAPAAQPPLLLTMGQVQVDISEAVFTGYQKRVYTVPVMATADALATFVSPAASVSASSSLHDEDEDVDSSIVEKAATPEPVPVLRSCEGLVCFHQEYTEECPTYKPGKLLETITILYGSTEALVDAGVICPLPPTFQVDCAIASDPSATMDLEAPHMKRPLTDEASSPQAKKVCPVVDKSSSISKASTPAEASNGGILRASQ